MFDLITLLYQSILTALIKVNIKVFFNAILHQLFVIKQLLLLFVLVFEFVDHKFVENWLTQIILLPRISQMNSFSIFYAN